MSMNPLRQLHLHGQSVWLDYIRRSLLTSGELEKLILEDGLMGMTSNPAIFEKAIAGSNDYNDALQRAVAHHPRALAKELYEELAIGDIKEAAKALLPIYIKTNKLDGYVSLEVSPQLANNTEGTLEEARRLWKAVDAPNLMIKVPGTKEGLPVIRQLIAEGINVNVTLLFAQEFYQQAAEAFLLGLEDRVAQGLPIEGIASVASFFISRIDTLVDHLLDQHQKCAHLKGKVAIANAKLTYQYFKTLYASERFAKLAKLGAQKQRLLWASTSTKNPTYKDVIYVEDLIGKETVNTIPPATFDAFRDHGKVADTLESHVEEAALVMKELAEVGIDFKQVTQQLLEEGIVLFVDAFVKLISAVESKRQEMKHTPVHFVLPTLQASSQHQKAVKKELHDWESHHKVHRLWARDSGLWTGQDESHWMGWLNVVEGELEQAEDLAKLVFEAQQEKMTHVALLGMGGSSLFPWMLMRTFSRMPNFPALHVLDSTDPAQIEAFKAELDMHKTLFVVSSKSGSTLEPNTFFAYFFSEVEKLVGKAEAAKRFIAITDPGSSMEQEAKSKGFRAVFPGLASIGGRYSALSNFGMVPAAFMGVHIGNFLDKAEEMVHACGPTILPSENPGVLLGIYLGVLHNQGQDKLTLVLSPSIQTFGAWLEQLIAESTGKEGRGLIPVDAEPLGALDVYGKDRVFVYLRLASKPDAAQDAAIAELEKAGHSVIRVELLDLAHLGAECFRWEIATAVAGSVIRINPFNQPDVEASKVKTKELAQGYEQTGELPALKPLDTIEGIQVFADDKNAEVLAKNLPPQKTLSDWMHAHLNRIWENDYFCISAYIAMNHAHEKVLTQIRTMVRDAKKVATCVGFGPRFLHSTGQIHKGGPNTGVFLQITCDDPQDIQVPDHRYTFGVIKEAQARGDFDVLVERDRRIVRVHLGKDVAKGLEHLKKAIEKALK